MTMAQHLIKQSERELANFIQDHEQKLKEMKEAHRLKLELFPYVQEIIPFLPVDECQNPVNTILRWSGLDCSPYYEFDLRVNQARWHVRLLWEWKEDIFRKWRLDQERGNVFGSEHKYCGRLRDSKALLPIKCRIFKTHSTLHRLLQ